jgi:WD40 repeat protein
VSADGPLSPYKGLTPFEDSELDVRFFFGRERERELIEANLMASRLTVLYGETGVGKSSVLRAGVAHHLRGVAGRNLAERGEPGMAVVVFDAWRDDPLHALRTAVADAVTQALGGSLRPPDDDVPLVDALRMWSAVLDGDIYLVLDQAEEYFLYHPADDDPESFAVQFPDVVNAPDLRANLLLAIREDALAKLDVFKARIPQVLGNYLRLEHLDTRAARAAIVEPVRAYNGLVADERSVTIEPALVDAVLEQVVAGKVDVGQSGRGAVAVGEATVRIETAYLQLVMYRLWDAEQDAGSQVLRLETLSRLGGAEQIVRDHVDEALTGLTADEKDLAARMLDHLVTPSGSKIAHEVGDLAEYAGAPEASVLPVLAKLGDERILRSVSGNGRRRSGYEIYHDVLADPVLAWKAAHEAERERERGAAEGRRRHRRLVRLLAAAGVALLVMAAVTIFAVTQWSRARSQAHLAHARELAGAALSDVTDDPLRSLVLALASARLKQTTQGEAVLRQALSANRERAVLPSGDSVRTVEYSPDGSLVLTGSADGTARLWHADGAPAHVLPQGGPVDVATFSRDGSLVLTAGRDSTALLWRTATGAPVATLPHGSRVIDASFSTDGSRVVTAAADRKLRVWRVGGGRPTLVVPLGGRPTGAAFSPDGTLLLVTGPVRPGAHAIARLFDAATGRLVRPLPALDVTTASFNPDGASVVTCQADGRIVLWRVRDGELLHVLVPSGAPRVTAVAFDRKGHLLAASNADGATHVWLTKSGGSPTSVHGHSGRVTHVEFSRDGRLLLTAGVDGTARVWLVRGGGQVTVLRVPGTAVADAAFSPDGSAVATADSDGAARLWNVADLLPLWTSARPVLTASFSPGGRRIVEGGDDGKARILSDRGRVLQVLPHGAPVRGAVFTPDGRLVLTDDSTGVLRIWNASTGTVVRSARNVSTGPLALSRDGRYLTAPTIDGAIGVWSVATLRRIHVFTAGGPFNATAFSPDGHLLGAAGNHDFARLVTARTGALFHLLRGHAAAVTGIAFSHDGLLAVTSSADDTARIWDIATGGQTQSLTGNSGPVQAASFSPDGSWVVTAGPARAGIWDVSTGKLLAFLQGHTAEVTAASFSPGGARILTASHDGTVRLYTCKICGGYDRLVAAATARLTALTDRLDPAQRARFVPSGA